MTDAALRHLGVQLAAFDGWPQAELWPGVAAMAGELDRVGVHSLLLMDHLERVSPAVERSRPILEPYVALSALATHTRQARLGALATPVTFRSPGVLAKTVTTLDVISGGRALLGLGAGWDPGEHHAYGLRFPPPRERLERLADTVRICRAMFAASPSSVTGRHHATREAHNVPPPVHPGGPPVLVAGGGERTTLRLVAELADMWNVVAPEEAVGSRLAALRRHCGTVGRDPASIVKTLHVVVRRPPDLGETLAPRRAIVLAGTLSETVDRIGRLLELGLDGVTLAWEDRRDSDAICEVARALLAGRRLVTDHSRA